jgi:hypothetical protein
MTVPLRREELGSWSRLVPVQEENKRLLVAGRWLAGAHDPVRLSPEPEVNGAVGPILGMTARASSRAELCVEPGRRKSQRRTSLRQGVKPALSSGE